MICLNNPILNTDSYKFTQFAHYPPDTSEIFSYFESRDGALYDETVFVGLQYLLEYLTIRVTPEKIDRAEAFVKAHVPGGVFNRAGWEHIVRECHGRLPLEIRAVPEGTVVPTGNVLMTVINTDPACAWLTSYVETLLVQLWYPSTVATRARYIKGQLKRFLEETGDVSGLDFMLHDFGFRGVSSPESTALGDFGHLTQFKGTDAVPGILFAQKFYGADEMPAFNIPATEHSAITSWGRDREADAYRHLLETFPTGLLSIVSDSYDIYNAVRNIYGVELKDLIMSREGTLVIRPDSGDPRTILPELLEIAWDAFGGHTNDKGYRVLDEHVRFIQGDGIDDESIVEICEAVKTAGFSLENLVFGSGGGLLQKMNRDTQRFAFKASYARTDRGRQDVYKDPVTQPNKASKKGRLKLIYNGGLRTVREEERGVDLLELAFFNGRITRHTTLDEIRERAAV